MIPGTVLGHYRILGPLGKGGMGEVYAAEDTKLNRRVALKLLPPALAADPDRRRRLEREAQTVATLNHPNIVTIYSVETGGELPFLTMELVEGRSLREMIPAGGMLIDVLLRTALAISDALTAAHQRGIVHRDLKPANVMVGIDDRIKVLDFGLAKLQEADAVDAGEAPTKTVGDHLTSEGRIVGTVAYMSPEQAEGKPVDQRSDIFSLGVMLHEMATGERPFRGDTEISVISSILKDAPGAITDVRPDLPLPLARMVKHCLVKDPQRRYQAARDLQHDLENLKQDLDSGGLSAPPAVAPRPRRRRTVMYAAGGTALAVVAIAAAWLALTHRPRLFVADRFTRLTDSGTVFLATLSADGRYVVHAKREANLTGLWVRQTGAVSDVRIVPLSDARINGAAFSPDGNFVYYSTYPRQSGTAGLYKVPVLGGTPVRVLDDVDSALSFAPDGSQFAFIRGRPAENRAVLMVANADGTGATELAAATAPASLVSDRAAWSPDGRTVVATVRSVANGRMRFRLVAVSVASGRMTAFGGEWSHTHSVNWMPDGRSVIMSAMEEVDRPAQLWQVTWPEGDRHRISTGANEYAGVSVAADGRTIATVEGEVHSNIWVFPVEGGPGRQLTSLVRGNVGGGGMAWTPQGRLLYTAAPGGGGNQLWAMDADGTNPTQLTNANGYAVFPAVAPDGRTVYYSGGQDGRAALFKMSLDGGESRRLTPGPSDYSAIVSPDGAWVYYTSGGDGRNRAMKVPAEGGTPLTLTTSETLFRASTISPDGSRLFGSAWNAAKQRSQPATASTQDGSVAFIDDAPPGARWMPDGKTWLYVELRNGTAGFVLKPIAGGPEVRFGDLGDGQALGVAVSRDSRLLAVVRGRSTQDVVLIKAK